MIFCGISFWADESCVDSTTMTTLDEMSYLMLTSGMIDDLYITRDIETEEISDTWGSDTILRSKFDGDTLGGNMSWVVTNVKKIILRRTEDGINWISLYSQDISTLNDFNISYKDYLCCAKKTYQYAFVPIFSNDTYGDLVYARNTDDSTLYVTTKFDGITVGNQETFYNTVMEVGDINTTRIQNVGVIALQNYAKPRMFINSKVNYDTGTVSGMFVKKDSAACAFDFDNAFEYRKEFLDFLTDGTVKFIKSWDGRAWIAAISDSPTDKSDGHHDIRIIEFSFTEIGDITSEKDLYNNGLINVEEEYWCKNYN